MSKETQDAFDLCAMALELATLRLGYDLAVIMSHRRDLEAMRMKRTVAILLQQAGYSLPAIGFAMKRHHTTILSLVNPLYRARRKRYFAQQYRKAHGK